MIKELRLENFKGLGKARIEFGDITILIGPNGVGKSSIIQALMVLRQSMDKGSLVASGDLIELGEFRDIKKRNENANHIGIGITVGLNESPLLGIKGNAVYTCDTYWEPDLMKFNAGIESFNGEHIKAIWDRESGTKLEPKLLVPQGEKPEEIRIRFKSSGQFHRPIVIRDDFIVEESNRLEKLKEIMKGAKSEADDIVDKLEKALRNVYYVPATRGIEKNFYNLADKYVIDLPAGSNLQLATTFAYASSAIKEMIEIWSNEITGSEISVNLIPNKRVVIESSEAGGIPVVVDGSGVNQLTQLLLMFGIVPSGSTLGIEEPEIHLHPKAQNKLCGLLAQLIKKVWKRQLIITTHSEHILYGFLSEMRKGNINREDLKIYYFEEKGSEPIYHEIDEGGDIYDWGKNFFDYS